MAIVPCGDTSLMKSEEPPVLAGVTLTVKVQGTALLFAASLAVYVMVVMPNGNAEPLVRPTVGAEVTVAIILAVQLSLTVGAVQVTTWVLFKVVILIFAGQFVKIGGVISVVQGLLLVTVTVKLHGKALLFAASLAA